MNEGSMHILLAEDDPAVSIVVQLCLEKIGGHTVELVSDGQAAIELSQQAVFDLIVLDGMMPIKSGLQAAEEIRQAGVNQTPIIFLSAKNDERDIKAYLKFGVGFIAKPFEPTQICAKIDSILADANLKGAG